MQKQKKNQKKRFRQPQLNLVCPFNGNPALIDYKDVHNLKKKYITTRGRIIPSEKTGVSARCQRKLALSIKRARFLAMLPYVNYV